VRTFGLLLAAGTVVSSAAFPNEPVAPRDREALAACLDKAEREGRPGESCIGIVEGPCLKGPDGDTTAGMKECTSREVDVWDDRLNRVYRDLLAGDLGRIETERMMSGKPRKVTGADLLREAQRAWIAARDRKCDAASLPMEGGTGAGLLTLGCLQGETARQVFWLEELRKSQ
jgi:uncharacterized protein YecT (DUF1311 family)